MVCDSETTLDNNIATMESIRDEDRKRRLRLLEEKIQDPRSIGNIDSLLDTVQAICTDCDYPAVKKIKNVEVYMNRCKYFMNYLYFFIAVNF